jgi:hypothetical protein
MWVSGRKSGAGPQYVTSEPRSRVGELAAHGLQDAGAVLARALVGPEVPGPIVVALGQDRDHLGGGQLVVARPRLVAAQRLQAVEDRTRVVDRLAFTGAGPDRAMARR